MLTYHQTKDRKFVENQKGRFSPETVGGIYHKMYTKPSFLDALDEWESIAKDEGISKAALAYRWVDYHSALKKEDGDALIFGASRPDQVEETLQLVEAGPLSQSAVQRIQKVWESVKGDSITDNFEAVYGKI